ncbi:MAG: hypothetical protein OIF32_06925 [Campylobacterales bacterium]|nr:hypothetical protein [Campylobacterales bacterium]
MRSDIEIGKGCEENGFVKGTKEYYECIESIKAHEKFTEKEIERKQKEEAEAKWGNRKNS